MSRLLSTVVELLDRGHPLNLVFDRHGFVVRASALAARVLRLKAGQRCEDGLILERPIIDDEAEWGALTGQALRFRSVAHPQLRLRGQVVSVGPKVWALLATPVVSDLDELRQLGFRASDLAPSDPTADLLATAAHRARNAKARHEKLAQEHQRQKLEVLGRLVGGISHDFNNLLVAILGHAGHALDETPEGSVRESLEGVIDAAERAAALTSRLLTFARPTATMEGPVDVAREVRSTAGLVRRLMRDAVELRLQVEPSSAWVPLDRSGLEQILVNLAVNARDAMPDGGLVDVRVERRSVDEGLAASLQLATGAYVLLSVRDTGVGIAAELQERVFEPFFTTKPVGQGTGLGLSTLLGLVKGAGGIVRIDSEVGRGSLISVWLPEVAAPVVRPHSDGFVQPTRIKRGKTVLLVDDDPRVRRIVARMLVKGGFEVCGAENPAEALRRMPPSADLGLVITDQNMPGGTGVELLERMRTLRPRCPAIVMSGYSDDPRLDQGARAGHFRMLVKPFNAEQLMEAVDRTLARSQLERLGESHLDPPTMPSWMGM